MLGFLRSYFSNDLAIDLGTANTLIYVRGKGIVLDEPSSWRSDRKPGRTGKKRYRPSARKRSRMLGKTPATSSPSGR